MRWLVVLGCSLALGSWAYAQPAPAGNKLIAVFGDSISTGAATHPALQMDARRLWDIFTGVQLRPAQASHLPPGAIAEDLLAGTDGILPAPSRPWPSPLEFLGGPDWVHRHAMQIMARRFLDTEPYSWAYQLGVKRLSGSLAERARQVMIAAENGARIEHLPRQLSRVLAVNQGQLAAENFVFFTGNDLCAAGAAQITSEDDYRRHLRQGLLALERAPAAPGGSDIYVIGLLGVLQLMQSEAILSKQVDAFGERQTCRLLRQRGFRSENASYDPGLPDGYGWFAYFMPPNPASYCATLFAGGAADDSGLVSTLANRTRAFRSIAKQLVSDMNSRSSQRTKGGDPSHRWHYIAASEDLSFAADDIANDCFHLSPLGQSKLAQAVAQGLTRP